MHGSSSTKARSNRLCTPIEVQQVDLLICSQGAERMPWTPAVLEGRMRVAMEQDTQRPHLRLSIAIILSCGAGRLSRNIAEASFRTRSTRTCTSRYRGRRSPGPRDQREPGTRAPTAPAADLSGP